MIKKATVDDVLSVIRPKPYNKRTRRTSYPVRHTKRAHIRAVLDEILQEQPKDIKEIARGFRERGLPAATKTDAGICRRPEKRGNDPGDRSGKRADDDYAEISHFLKKQVLSGRQIHSEMREKREEFGKFAVRLLSF